MSELNIKNDYLKILLENYYPLHYFAVFRAHELYNLNDYVDNLKYPLLDLGCGDGTIANLLFDKQIDYGIDLSDETIQAAKKSGVYKQLFQGSAHNIPLYDNSLNSIFSNCVFEHIPDMPKLIKEISRVLKPGGYLLTSCNNPYYYDLNPVFNFLNNPISSSLRNKMIEKENKLHNHVSVHTIEEYDEMFKANNMTIEKHHYYGHKKLVNFTHKWDTLSKYDINNFDELTHHGYLVDYLYKKHKRYQKDKQVSKWYEKYYNDCYTKDLDKKGIAQIMLVRKNDE